MAVCPFHKGCEVYLCFQSRYPSRLDTPPGYIPLQAFKDCRLLVSGSAAEGLFKDRQGEFQCCRCEDLNDVREGVNKGVYESSCQVVLEVGYSLSLSFTHLHILSPILSHLLCLSLSHTHTHTFLCLSVCEFARSCFSLLHAFGLCLDS